MCKMQNRVRLLAVCLLLLVSPSLGGVVYVDADAEGTGTGRTWTNAYSSVAEAIEASSTGDELWVAEGTYRPIELKDGVEIIGGFAGGEADVSQADPTLHKTIISGGGTARAIVGIDVGSGTVLRGLRVTEGVVAFPDTGAGMLLQDSDVVLVQCTFENNRSATLGGAAMIRGGSPRFVNCRFSRNDGGWGAGAVFSQMFATPTFVNCVFDRNKAQESGAISVRNGKATFVNCTIADNRATYGKAGALFDNGGESTLSNCVMRGNASPITGTASIFNMPNSRTPTTVTYSNVQGGWPGADVVDADPLFVNPAAGDYRLQSASPCKDKGKSELLPGDSADLNRNGNTSETLPRDLDMNNRIQGSSVDMGAYEWHAFGG